MTRSIRFATNTSAAEAIISRAISSGEASGSLNNRKVLVVTGGTGKIATSVIGEGTKRGYDVYACTRKESVRDSHVKWNVMSEDEMSQPGVWKNLFAKVSEGASSLSFANTIGVAVPPKGKSHQDINERPVLAAIEALQSFRMKKSIAHVSSIAATYLPDDEKLLANFDPQGMEYCLGRRRIDLILQNCGIPATITRPGFVCADVQSDGSIDSGHDYSPEQFTQLLIHPLIGTGEQIHQPVYVGDLVQALFNGIETDRTHVVNAVGPETMTQEEMIKFFVELASKDFKPIKIPIEVGRVIAKHFPKGRLAPYSVSLLKHLEENHREPISAKPFEDLVRRPLTAIGKIYARQKAPFIFPKSPVAEHLAEIIAGIANNPLARADFFRVVKKYGPGLILEAIKVVLVHNVGKK